jgi:DNA polymerase (family X)
MLASSAIREARRAGIAADAIVPVGSIRRFAPDIGDVALLGLVAPGRQKQALRAFGRLPIVSKAGEQTATSATISTTRGDVTLHVAAPEDAGAALVWLTGSKRHVAALQQRARAMGVQFEAGRLMSPAGDPIPCPREEDLYERLGLPMIPPELRDDAEVIGAAERGEIPPLLTELHIRGDLHMHSTWSDGRNSIADMVSAAKQIGYEYVAITDHSERAWSSRTLAPADVPRQREEIEQLRERVHGIEILHGIEVDIMPDGTLDFDDDLLAGFDIVLASLHDAAGQAPKQLMARYLRALQHPLVNVITHPANRSPAQSPGYALDFDELFAAAALTGTALEVDGAPGHLDMDGELARRAAQAEVTIVVDSDCHRMDGLGRQMRFAVGTARRGWLERRHVLNTRPVTDLRAFLARKRERA